MAVGSSLGDQLIAIEISGDFNSQDIFTARLYNNLNGKVLESTDLVSSVKKLRFSDFPTPTLKS